MFVHVYAVCAGIVFMYVYKAYEGTHVYLHVMCMRVHMCVHPVFTWGFQA